MKKFRILLATVFFVAICLLMLDFTGTLHQHVGWAAKMQFLPALLALNVAVVLALVVLTLFAGRIYCSVVCPLGVMQDIFYAISHRGKKRKYSGGYKKPKTWIRVTVLILFTVLIIAGFTSIAALIAPYSTFGRMMTTLIQPIYIGANNCLADFCAAHECYTFYHVPLYKAALPALIITGVTFILIVTMAWRGGRTWCNTICPVGTVLGWISKYSFLKPVIDTAQCNNCGLCAKSCKASCIDPDKHEIDYTRCVTCMDCLYNCRHDAISYCHPGKGFKKSVEALEKAKKNAQESPADPTRRTLLLGTLVAAASSALAQEEKKVDGGLAEIIKKEVPERQTPIAPPGAQSLKNFTQHCTACQLCISECPSQVLRPSMKLDNFMQPVMEFERGYCRPECNRCSEVCPTGAIKLITPERKSSTQVGHAVWIEKNCLPATTGEKCNNCERHCPVHAISMVHINPDDRKSPRIPAVNEERCIGCGACENLCPASPFSAMVVEGHEVHKEV